MLGLFFFQLRQDAQSGGESLPTRRDTEAMRGVGRGSARETSFVDFIRLAGWLPGTSSLSDPPLPQLSVKFAGAKNSAAGNTGQELKT